MSTNETQEFKPKSIFEEVGKVGLVLSFLGSEITLSGLAVFLAKLFGLPGQEELHPILDVLFTSLPLTVAVAVMFVNYKENKLTLGNSFWTLTGAIMTILFLNIFFDLGMPNVPLNWNFGWFGVIPSYLFNFFKMYGPFPFIKSCVLGYFFGKWYLQLAIVASKIEQLKKPSAENETQTD